jgi:LysM repeat protein
MKRFLIVPMLLTFAAAQAQDAAVEERLNKLSGYIEELQAAKVSVDKRMTALVKEVESLRDANKSNGTVATQDDIKRLTDAIKEVDRKRLEDYEKIHQEIEKLAKILSTTGTKGSGGKKKEDSLGKAKEGGAATGAVPQNGYEHTIAAGDTLSTIAQAYREQYKIKVTSDQILKANPGLKANSLIVGKKIFIPAQ